jgi:DNA topoisomerase-3
MFFKIVLEPKKTTIVSFKNQSRQCCIDCPKCKKGTIIKGNSAYGCTGYKEGCDFKVSFDVERKIKDQKLLKN